MRDDPWKDLARPSVAESASARRVDAAAPWDFFWGRDVDGKVLLLLQHSGQAVALNRLPNLHGVEIIETPGSTNSNRGLCFRLLIEQHRDIFYSLCSDIVQAASTAPTEEDAVAVALMRAWRWHHLLRGGTDGRLSNDEQKGLIGELAVIETILLRACSPADAVRAWRGPTGAPKDFEIGMSCIEAKARRGAASPHIAISSEHQLDDEGLDALFVHVINLHAAIDGTLGESVTAVAMRVRAAIEGRDPSAAAVFEGLLLSAGFRWADDYSEDRWERGAVHVFQVGVGFPRVRAQELPSGVSRVRYTVGLHECEPYEIKLDTLVAYLATPKEPGSGT